MTNVDVAQRAISREWTGVCEVLESSDEEVWLLPTRCEGWSVTELVRHMCWGTSFEADGLLRARTEAGGVAAGTEADTTRPRELVSELKRCVEVLVTELEALQRDPHDRPLPMPYGSFPVPLALTVFTMEAGMHNSDLRAALSLDDRIEPDIVDAAFEYLRAIGPGTAEQAGSVLEGEATVALRGSSTVRFGQDSNGVWYADDSTDATAWIAGDDSDLMLFAFGRRPLDGLEIRGDVNLGSRFKQLVPGP